MIQKKADTLSAQADRGRTFTESKTGTCVSEFNLYISRLNQEKCRDNIHVSRALAGREGVSGDFGSLGTFFF